MQRSYLLRIRTARWPYISAGHHATDQPEIMNKMGEDCENP